MGGSQQKYKKKYKKLSYHIRNVPGLSSIEISPGCGFTMPKKKLVSSSADSGFSKDDGGGAFQEASPASYDQAPFSPSPGGGG
jgi:hypothetical protein